MLVGEDHRLDAVAQPELHQDPSPARGRRVALSALAFAIVGFIFGLTVTVGGGDAIDLIYHAVMLPILVVSALLVARRRPGVSRPSV